MECFCGNERPSVNSDVDASKCNKFCPGDSEAKCGGYLTMNVYQTGVIPFKSEPARDDEVSKAEALRNPVRIVYLVCAVYNCFSLLPFSLHTNIKAIFLKMPFHKRTHSFGFCKGKTIFCSLNKPRRIRKGEFPTLQSQKSTSKHQGNISASTLRFRILRLLLNEI